MRKKIIFIFLFAILACSTLALSAKAANITDTRTGLDATAGKVDAFKSLIGNDFGPSFMASQAGQLIGLILSFIAFNLSIQDSPR